MKDQYNTLYSHYEWLVPSHFNIAEACCHRWAANPHEARQVAIYFEDQVGQLTLYTYKQLSETVNKLASAFVRMGVEPQDRIIIALEHSAETAVAILAAMTIGAIAVPLPADLHPSEYQARFYDSMARVAIVDKHTSSAVISAIDHHCPVKQVVGIHTNDERLIQWRTLLARQPADHITSITTSDSPAIMFYSTNEQGELKATILNHGALIGLLPGFVCSQNWFPKKQDTFWTCYGWNIADGILHALLPVLYFGRSIVGCPSGRTIPRLFTLLEHYQITNILISGSELLRIMTNAEGMSSYELAIRCISCPDTDLNSTLRSWVNTNLKVDINGFLSSPGFAYIIGDSHEKWPSIDGCAGRTYPGHRVAILDDEGRSVKAGQFGELAVCVTDSHEFPDPVLAHSYWSKAQIHSIPKNGDWIMTGIRAKMGKQNAIWRDEG